MTSVHRFVDVDTLLKSCSPELRDELEWKLEVDRESEEDRDPEDQPTTEGDAFREIAEDIDEETPEGGPMYSPAMRREVMRILIAAGCYEPISEEMYRNMKSGGVGVKAKHFPKVGKQRYNFVGWGPFER